MDEVLADELGQGAEVGHKTIENASKRTLITLFHNESLSAYLGSLGRGWGPLPKPPFSS